MSANVTSTINNSNSGGNGNSNDNGDDNNVSSSNSSHSPPQHSPNSQPQSAKQRRILSPCVNCRRRKRKCTGERPVCQFCRKNNLQCEWTEVSKRGPRKGYIDELEGRAQVADGALKVLREFLQRIPRAQWPMLRYEDNEDVFERFKTEFGVTNLNELCQWYDRVTRVPGMGDGSSSDSSGGNSGSLPNLLKASELELTSIAAAANSNISTSSSTNRNNTARIPLSTNNGNNTTATTATTSTASTNTARSNSPPSSKSKSSKYFF